MRHFIGGRLVIGRSTDFGMKDALLDFDYYGDGLGFTLTIFGLTIDWC